MGRLIDYDSVRHICKNYTNEDAVGLILADREDMMPTVEAIPKAEVKKFLEEGTKNVSNNVLAIVREDYIHKADYEARLKADMAAMLTELQLEIEEIEKPLCHSATYAKGCVDRGRIEGLIQQKINSLKREE